MTEGEVCPCGEDHDFCPEVRDFVESFIALRGGSGSIDVHTPYGSWKVPVYYIALHGLKAWELPELAKRCGFEKVSR